MRSLLDTHRNQGIGSILLRVKGRAEPEAVKRHLKVRKLKFGHFSILPLLCFRK